MASLHLAFKVIHAARHERLQWHRRDRLVERAGVGQQFAHPGFEPVRLRHDVARRVVRLGVVTVRDQLRRAADRGQRVAYAMRHGGTHLADDGQGFVLDQVALLAAYGEVGAPHQAEQGREQRGPLAAAPSAM